MVYKYCLLHKWGEYEHPTFTEPKNAGNGLILYLVVDDVNPVWDNALKLKARIDKRPEINPATP
jgi:hypothetical protein